MDEDAKETPTEFLIRSLENIENVEDVVLVVKDSDGEVTYYSNDLTALEITGMLAWAQHQVYEDANEDESDD